ncbi:MAG: FAD-dependent oxidoreductase [Gemmatimonadaceae bacterium]|nr:FAD-dependent oxidoreductase [Gemmatimonadaceae bacterium]
MDHASKDRVIIVGAGVAGLTCAIALHRAGRDVLMLEAQDDVGGRVRSSRIDGATIDHGFQVMFTAYPTLRQYLDLPALALRRFDPAARIVRNGKASLVGDGLRDSGLLVDTLMSGAFPFADKVRLLALRTFVNTLSIDDCFSARFANQSTRNFLVSRGFQAETLDGFFAPFYGGILLDRTLSTSASVLLFTFKMLAEGDTVIPAGGMGAITAALAANLPRERVRVGVRVAAVRTNPDGVHSVSLADGSVLDARHVVIATDAPMAVQLARTAGVTLSEPSQALDCTTLWYRAERALLPGKALWLNAAADAVISHAVTITDVAPEYSEAGPVISATAVGASATLPDEDLDAAARTEIASMSQAGGMSVGTDDVAREVQRMTRLAVSRVPFAQFAQPPGARAQQPSTACGVPGLWRASETFHSSSLEGAARGGTAAAHATSLRNSPSHTGHTCTSPFSEPPVVWVDALSSTRSPMGIPFVRWCAIRLRYGRAPASSSYRATCSRSAMSRTP